MAKVLFAANALIGGVSGCLDDILHTALEDGNTAIVINASTNTTYFYTYDASEAGVESSPDIIIPTSNVTGTGAWVLANVSSANLTIVENEREVNVNHTDGYPGISDSSIGITQLSIAEDTWSSVGPTGGGKTNTWDALDSVSTDVDWIRVRMSNSVVPTSPANGTLSIHTRKNGSVITTGVWSRIYYAYVGSYTINRSVVELTLPVNSRAFDIYFDGDSIASRETYFTLVGYGWNPA